MSGSRLTDGFRDIIELRWSEFVEVEQSVGATNFDAIVTTIARACMKGNLRAIQTALDRLDGKIASEIEVEYPKFYTLYPMATKTADDPSIIPAIEENGGKILLAHTPKGHNDFYEMVKDIETQNMVMGAPADMDEQMAMEEELPTGSLRAVLEKMLDSPKTIVNDIIVTAEKVDGGDLSYGDPMVKSVIVAGLMKLVHDGRINAVFEVFDQIDGKVADKYKMLGDDVYIKNFASIAPAGAVKNEDGIYQIAADNITDAWVMRLEQANERKKRK